MKYRWNVNLTTNFWTYEFYSCNKSKKLSRTLDQGQTSGLLPFGTKELEKIITKHSLEKES